MNRIPLKNTRPSTREKKPKRESLQPGSPGLAKRGLPKWVLLTLLATSGFGVAYALATWTRGGSTPSDGPPGMVWIPGGEFTMGTDSDLGWPD